MKKNETKQKVMDAACKLFYAKGYHGTSVRDIAKSASVNVSLISYYFTNKQGLLEASIVSYYEEYLEQLDLVFNETENMLPIDRLKKMVESIIHYKQNQHQFTSFTQRELMLDSVFVREMMVTYLAKENYIISKVFYDALSGTTHSSIDREFLLLQLKGLLIAPYIAPNEWKKHIDLDQSHNFFVKKYTKSIHSWLDHLTELSHQKISNSSTPSNK